MILSFERKSARANEPVRNAMFFTVRVCVCAYAVVRTCAHKVLMPYWSTSCPRLKR